MVERIFDLYDDLERHRVMLSFKGELTPDLIAAVVDLVERKVAVIEPDQRMRKRVFNVVVECLQNLYHHGPAKGGAGPDPASQGVVMVAQAEKGYSVLTGNAMADAEVKELKDRLDRVNGCEPDQLRDLYKSILGDGRFSRNGGGGLGLIDIARKSGKKLEYGFIPMEDGHTFFSLNVNVTS